MYFPVSVVQNFFFIWSLITLLIYSSHTKKCWVKYNPVLGKIWTNPAIGLFRPSGWATAQKVELNI